MLRESAGHAAKVVQMWIGQARLINAQILGLAYQFVIIYQYLRQK